MSIVLPKGGPKYEKLKLKKCQYKGCENWYMGTGFSRYCVEHRKKEYKKKSKKIFHDNSNIIIKHTNCIVTDREFICDTCGKKYTVKLFPNIFVYPKNCENHRNEYRRNLYIKTNGKYVNDTMVTIDLDERTIFNELCKTNMSQ